MKYICSREQMQKLDRFSMEEIGISSAVLMERAALSVFEEIKERYDNKAKCLILVGAGNNGGDGLALSRMLFEAGYPVWIAIVGNHRKSSECEAQLNILHNMGKCGAHTGPEIEQIESRAQVNSLSAKKFDVVVDSIFGIGLSREIVSPEWDVIEMANKMQAFKVALDIPSGLDANHGAIQGIAFMADLTVTFGYQKLGMLFGAGPDVSGQVLVKDIGFPRSAGEKTGLTAFTYDNSDLIRLPKRNPSSNKGTYGRAAVIAGCETMAGAACFSAAAAYRSGAGLVKVYTHSYNRDILLSRVPEAVFEAYDLQRNLEMEEIGRNREILEEEQAKKVVASAADFADVIVIGPGLGRSFMAECLVKAALMQSGCPVIIDADGLNILSEHIDWLKLCQTEVILTPHLKEMERLVKKPLAYIKENRLSLAKQLAQDYGVVCVLKDAHTIVAGKSPETYINTTGNQGMSTGGTGDVLTGVIAAMAAAGTELAEAARLGVMLHGMAADAAAGIKSMRGMVAGDLLDGLCSVFSKAEKHVAED